VRRVLIEIGRKIGSRRRKKKVIKTSWDLKETNGKNEHAKGME
jgi:hypothetical protein